MNLKTLIVDDEPLAREGLKMLLAADSDVSSVAEARNGVEAVEIIRDTHPDLVFLDVQMPDMDGLSVVKTIGAEHMPVIVFVTAHDRYAIHAFEANAIDYLLKPVTSERFLRALDRAKSRLKTNLPDAANQQILSLLETVAPANRYPDRLAVRSRGKTTFVNVSDIEWIEAAENYVQLNAGGKSHLLAGTISALEKSLDPHSFVRVHRSTIVNVSLIRDVEPSPHGEYQLTLHNGKVLQSGRQYREKLKELISNPF